MYKLAIIGSGQLGSRHLQGLAKSKLEIEIHVVDPSQRARGVARIRFSEVANEFQKKNILFHKDITELPNELDLVIVSTTANMRRKVIENLLKQKIVKYIILEKVVFQRSDDFLQIQSLLAKNGTTGVGALVDRDVIFDIYVSLALIRSKGEVIPEYLLEVINSLDTKKQFNKFMNCFQF